MSPTIVFRNNRPVVALGAAGGPTIITQTALAIINMIDFGLDIEAALAEPRFHHQWSPNELRIERSVGETVLQELERRGHKLSLVDAIAATQAVAINPESSGLIGVTDPRIGGKAGGL
jgi:gamma-glutamyltranspeptidase / glutathione hydrolase